MVGSVRAATGASEAVGAVASLERWRAMGSGSTAVPSGPTGEAGSGPTPVIALAVVGGAPVSGARIEGAGSPRSGPVWAIAVIGPSWTSGAATWATGRGATGCRARVSTGLAR